MFLMTMMKTVAVRVAFSERKCRGWKHFYVNGGEYHFGVAC